MKAKSKPVNLNLTFEALSNEHRREILHTLSLRPASISDLAKERELSLQAIHKHINQLVEAGMVTRKKSGRITFLTLNRAAMRDVQKWVNQFHAYWDAPGETLENYSQTIEYKKKLKNKTRSEK
jgi:DNA-binding transcriptional ArsR family regulator